MFWDEYVLEMINCNGGSANAGFDIMSVVCRKIDDSAKSKYGDAIANNVYDFNEERFILEVGESIDASAKKARTEYNQLVKSFADGHLTKDGTLYSGKTWDSTLSEFVRAMWLKEMGNKDAKKAAGGVPQVPPKGWTPCGAHAWLLFVCFGQYGKNKWNTKRPAYLGGPGAADIDGNRKTSRRMCRQPARGSQTSPFFRT